MLIEAGFQIVRQTHIGFFIYPAFWLAKQRSKRFLSVEKIVQQKVVESHIRKSEGNGLVKMSFHLESFLGQWVSFPFGIRCELTCRK